MSNTEQRAHEEADTPEACDWTGFGPEEPVQHLERCWACRGGEGIEQNGGECPVCHGEGELIRGSGTDW